MSERMMACFKLSRKTNDKISVVLSCWKQLEWVLQSDKSCIQLMNEKRSVWVIVDQCEVCVTDAFGPL